MEYSINEKTVEAVLTSVNLETKIDGGNLEVVIGDSAKMEVNEAVNYIKSGQAEVQQVVDTGTATFNANALAKTEAFNNNASSKTTAFNDNASSKTADFNTNASAKTTAFDENAGSKLSEYNSNATEKTDVFNQNADAKTNAFNDNVILKTSDFNANSTNKTNIFNQNAVEKTSDFNTNATNKTTAFNDNYAEKKALIDEQVGIAETAAQTATTQAGIATTKAGEATNQANLSKQYAIGDPTEPTEHSAKYWAEQAESELSGLSSRVTTIEGKIPSSATSSNQLTDKYYVDNADTTLRTEITDLREILNKLWTFTFEQGVASDTWVIEHNLGRNPSVTIVDSSGRIFTPAVQYDNENQVTVTMNGATTGKAYLN